MKNFIVTAASVLLILTVMQLQLQCGELLRRKQFLKYTAEEAAASAALCLDAERFGDGILRFDRILAERKAEEIIGLNLTEEEQKELEWEIHFFEEDQSRPYVTVILYQQKLKVSSTYEYAAY